MRKLFSLLSGLVVGALVGSTLAILFAPASGEEIRLRLVEKTRNLREEIKQAAAERRAELEQQLAALRAPQPKA